MSITSISTHEDYTALLDELYPLLDTPAAGLTVEETQRMKDIMAMVNKWEKDHEN